MDQFRTTKRQQEVLRVIDQLTKASGGTGPTYRELAAAMHISSQAASQISERLAAHGKVRWVLPSPPARTLQVVKGSTA